MGVVSSISHLPQALPLPKGNVMGRWLPCHPERCQRWWPHFRFGHPGRWFYRSLIDANITKDEQLVLRGFCVHRFVCLSLCCCLVAKLCPILLLPPWNVAHQAPLFIGYPRKAPWNGLPPGDPPNPGIEPASPALTDGFFNTEPLGKKSKLWRWKDNLSPSAQLLSCVQLFVTTWTAARQASLSITNSQSLPKVMSIESVMPSNHLIFGCPLLLLPSIFTSIRVFSNESALHIRWPKYWPFSFKISPSNEYPGLL